ncbi:MAG: hypothetical protein CL666_07285 [Balneola sp.]|nr:hypothetical protein [Balneola sp.]|tara:strand:+ start:70303 stop:72360 length:2058 start_codon:yes stop_codon:yes gene_type:complete
MNYELQAIFSLFRLLLGFFFVFGLITPLFFNFISTKKGIDRIVFSWISLGGLLVVGSFILVTLNIYDFISILFFLLTLPLLVKFFKRTFEGENITDIFTTAEHSFVATHINKIEQIKELTFSKIKERFKGKAKLKITKPYSILAVLIALAGSGLRIAPAIQNSAPFSRLWYFELGAVKGLSLQQYFDGFPEPKGMHSLISFFSTITQISPEMILHLIGGLISFFLAVIIFWMIQDITKQKYPAASLFGTMLYAIFPSLFLPVSMELETELSSLAISLSFALPTMLLFLRNIRSGGNTPWFYVFMGVIATGMTNIFILLMVLLPFMIFGLISIPKGKFFRYFGKSTLYLTGVFILTLSPFIGYCLIHDIAISTFFQDQLFDTQVFSFAPNLIIPIQDLSVYYLTGGAFLLFAYIARFFIQKRKRLSDEVVFISFFILLLYIYTPYFEYQYIWVDPDQLNIVYGIFISICAGLALYSVFLFMEWAIQSFQKITPYLSPALVLIFAFSIFMVQGGFQSNRLLPQTLPNGFFEAYYKIVNERVPYTYATVGPELDRELSVNRHYFMTYQYFLNNYGAIDSLYQQYLTVPAEQRSEVQEVPPASIFIFVEKPPYGSIQQGILYDAQSTMRDIEQWLSSFREMEGRTLEVYHETDQTTIYEIVNREGESTIEGVLNNIYPKEEGRAARLYK